MLNKIALFGVGLIGGSFALALKEARAVRHVTGLDRSVDSLRRASELGILDSIAEHAAEAVDGADLVLVAAPVSQTEAILASIQPHLRSGTVVTDAGSTKSDVIAAARRAMGRKIAQFVPGHPVAGRELTGPDAAIPDLYRGKKVVITPLPENAAADVQRVTAAWERCGALIHRLSPAEHDSVFAAVSHLPHLLAFALVDGIAKHPHMDRLFLYAGSGFRDFTRIAAASPEMWRDISLANRAAILTELDAYLAGLARVRALLAAGDGEALESVYANAQRARMAWTQGLCGGSA